MRFTLKQAPLISLTFLPLVIAYNGHGIFGALFWMTLWLVASVASVIFRVKTRRDDTRVILESLPISHYVEKVRWCLDKSGIKYEEEKDIGIFWVMTTGRIVPTLKIPANDISISNSSDILRYLYGHIKGQDEQKAKFLEPSPESVELEAKLDKLAYHIRTWLYFQFLVNSKSSDEMALKTWGIHEYEIPPWQRGLLKIALPILKKFLIFILKVDKEHALENLKKAEAIIDEMDKILSKHQFLMGTDEPTYVDFAYAALIAIIVFPDQYGGSNLSPESRFKMTDGNMEVQKYCKKMRNSPSGKFVLRMYSEHR